MLKDLDTIASEVDCRSLYAKPFALDAADLDKITAFFNKAAPVNCVRLRRHVASRNFRGSVFVEFSSVEHANSVLTMKLEYDGAPVMLVRKADYMAKVKLQRKTKKAGAGKVRMCQNACPTFLQAATARHSSMIFVLLDCGDVWFPRMLEP